MTFVVCSNAQVIKDVSIKAGPTFSSRLHIETSHPYNYSSRKLSHYDYLGYYFGVNSTFIFGKLINIGLEGYCISKGSKYRVSNYFIGVPHNLMLKSHIDYAGLSMPLKIKVKRQNTGKSRRNYFIVAPRMDFELRVKNGKFKDHSIMEYDSTKKIMPGLFLASGVEWKKERFCFGIEWFYTFDFCYLYSYFPYHPEHMRGKHRTWGAALTYRWYYMKSKNNYNKYY